MTSLRVWHDLDPNHGVLQFHETLSVPGPPLELHVVHDKETGGSAAWWEDDAGNWLWIADMGEA
jgi:hypothetical protein